MHAVTPDRAHIWWDATGAGPSVLLAPGRGDRSHLFPAEFSRRLVDGGCRVLRVDPRDSRPAGEGRDVLADDMLVVLDAAGVDRGHLIGVSSSAPVLVDLATRFPERVRSLSFISAMRPGTEGSTISDLEHIGCPSLVIHGAADPSSSLPHAYALANHLPSAFVQFHPTMGHVPTVEQWMWIAELVIGHVHAASTPDTGHRTSGASATAHRAS